MRFIVRIKKGALRGAPFLSFGPYYSYL
jgi:hypothetical protein